MIHATGKKVLGVLAGLVMAGSVALGATINVSPGGGCSAHGDVGTTCSNNSATCGAAATPCCTVQEGLDRLKGMSPSRGNLVEIHRGTYQECAQYASQASDDMGTQAEPIQIGAALGDEGLVVIDARGLSLAACPEDASVCRNTTVDRAALSIAGSWSGWMSWVKVHDLVLRPPGLETEAEHNFGLDLECVENVEAAQVTFDAFPTFSGTCSTAECGDGAVGLYEARKMILKGMHIVPTARTTGWQAFTIFSGAHDVTIVGSEVKHMVAGLVHSGGASQMVLAFNNFEDVGEGADGGNVIQTYNTKYNRVAWNKVSGSDGAVSVIRSYCWETIGAEIWNNNTVEAGANPAAYAFNVGKDSSSGAVALARFRNNLIKGYGIGIKVQDGVQDGSCPAGPPFTGTTCVGLQEGYNAYIGVTTPLSDQDSGCAWSTSNAVVSSTNPLGTDWCPHTLGASVVNAGDPVYSIPENGTPVVDIGACEYGQPVGAWAGPYEFVTRDTVSTYYPTLNWNGYVTSSTVDFTNLDFKEYLIGTNGTKAAQTSYRCQIDMVYTFDSQGLNKPLWDSGEVASSTEQCTDSTVGLAPGTYWARVKLNNTGWSDYFKFYITTPPGGGGSGGGSSVPPYPVLVWR